MRHRFFQQSRVLSLVTWSMGHVWEPLTLSQHLAWCSVYTSFVGGDMNFICHETPQDHSVEMPFISMGDSSSQHVTILKSLVSIGILMVKRKNTSSKTGILQTCTATGKLCWLDNQPLGEKKLSQRQKSTFWEEVPKNLKIYFSPYDYRL